MPVQAFPHVPYEKLHRHMPLFSGDALMPVHKVVHSVGYAVLFINGWFNFFFFFEEINMFM